MEANRRREDKIGILETQKVKKLSGAFDLFKHRIGTLHRGERGFEGMYSEQKSVRRISPGKVSHKKQTRKNINQNRQI